MKEIYKNHALCVRNDCTLASRCLRAMGYQEVSDDDKTFPVVNPNIVTAADDCTYVAVLEKERFARGFRKAFEKLPVAAANDIYHSLMSHFGKNPYYDRRNGKKLIPPEEQKMILALFASAGCEGEVFDAFEYQDVWKGER